MKIKILFIALALMSLATVNFAQSVKITPKKVTYNRKGADVPDFKKTFTINYPKVAGKFGKKIETLLSYEKNFGFDLKEEINETQWLSDANYKILYNKDGILSIALSIEGVGAYPSGSTKHLVIDLSNGTIVKPTDAFNPLNGIVTLCNKKLREEIKEEVARIKKEEPNEEIGDLFDNKTFKTSDLKEFSVSEKGVTFHYDYGFPHAVQAWQPIGDYFFRWTELRPFIKKVGVFGQFVK